MIDVDLGLNDIKNIDAKLLKIDIDHLLEKLDINR